MREVAAARTAPRPSILLVWDPMEVARWQELDELNGWWIAGTVSSTSAGDRAVVYRTKHDQGLAGVFDFASPAFPHPDLGWAAVGRPLPLDREVTRHELLSSSVAAIFRYPRGRRTLDSTARKEIASLLGSAPSWQQVDDELPDLRSEDWTWRRRSRFRCRGYVPMRDRAALHPRRGVGAPRHGSAPGQFRSDGQAWSSLTSRTGRSWAPGSGRGPSL